MVLANEENGLIYKKLKKYRSKNRRWKERCEEKLGIVFYVFGEGNIDGMRVDAEVETLSHEYAEIN